MGGSIFKSQGVEARTIDKYEYDAITFEIIVYCLGGAFKNSCDIRSFLNKDKFSDCDFLCSAPFSKLTNWKDLIINCPQIKRFITNVTHNGSEQFSILYKGVQCDFRIIEPKYWESSVYYSNDDPASNAFGRMARFFGCRFAYRGLYYPIYTKNGCNHLGDIDLTISPEEISEFFGVDHNQKIAGFNNVEDIFEFIVSSKYYSVECFDPKNWDSATRTRNRKRKRFCQFLDYINEKYPIRKFEYLPYERKSEYIHFINEKFPEAEVLKKVKAARKSYEVDRETLEKFNGHDAMKLSGLSGAEFGKIFSNYKKAKVNWLDFLRGNSKRDIEKDFSEFLTKK